MLRSHHLCLYCNTQRKNYEVRSYEVSGEVCAGGIDTDYFMGLTIDAHLMQQFIYYYKYLYMFRAYVYNLILLKMGI